jgi:hypothetical protein
MTGALRLWPVCRVWRKPARNSAACASSQPFDVQRFLAFDRSFTEKLREFPAWFWIGQSGFPRGIIWMLSSAEQETREISYLGPLVVRQRLAQADDLLGGCAHLV